MIKLFRVILPAACLALGLLLITACGERSVRTVNYPDRAIAENNRGVALMGRFDYETALNVFAQLRKQYPQVVEFQVNHAIALLNRQQDGDEAAALEELLAISAAHPDNAHARYSAGLLLLRAGKATQAVEFLLHVAKAHPRDAHAAYFLGQALEQSGDFQGALQWYETAIERDPYVRSAYYASFLSHRRLQQTDKAREKLEMYQQLASNPRAQLAEFKYTRMGRKAEVIAISNPFNDDETVPTQALYRAPRSLIAGLKQHGVKPNITLADIDGDGLEDIFIAGASATPGNFNSVLIAGKDGYVDNPTHPLTAVDKVNSALWGDIDNDGDIDVYLCRDGHNQLWRQDENRQWRDVSLASKSGGAQVNTLDGALFDADHDGDLDIFVVNADASNELFNNDLDGGFRPLAAQQGLSGNGHGSKGIVILDIDNDRDTDIVVINNKPPHSIYINDRMWAYHEDELYQALRETDIAKAVSADADADGQPELFVITDNGDLNRWKRSANGAWSRDLLGRLAESGDDYLAVFDGSGDGNMELLIGSSKQWQVYPLAVRRLLPLYQAGGGHQFTAFARVYRDAATGPGMLALSRAGELLEWQPGSGRLPFLGLRLTGLEKQADSMRSNASGIGTRVALRRGSHWTLTDTFRHDSGPGQSLQALALGLGGASTADFVSLTWSDGVLQTEMALAAGKLHDIAETQRQLSSCPVLFAWDGERYRFISDLLGVGGVGFMLAPGEYATPRPWENFLMPVDSLRGKQGRFHIKIGEPMEEAAYLDAVRLVAYDIPPGWELGLDERMGLADPRPSGRAFYFRRSVQAQRVLDTHGQEVTELVARADLRAPEVGELDRRFIGRLRDEQIISLYFAQPIKRPGDKAWLLIDGWLEYPYSQTMFAAWQADAHFQAPTLEALTASGDWQVVYAQFGYPAGMPRRMAMPLDKLPAGTRAIRLRTNQEIYWDRVAIAYEEPNQRVTRHELPLASANVAHTGFALRTTGTQRQPGYDYQRRAPLWDTRHMSGYYTEFGRADALLAEADDALAIIGPGEEVHFEYLDTLPALAQGWTRRFVIESHGWAKDMDMFTRDGDTLTPLPSNGAGKDARAPLHARYNTRFRSGY